ncbi:MAG: cytochrome P460 family protein, partial [Planctomycetaceae bacterium]
LDQSILFQGADPLAEMRVWPEGTLIVLEVYDGDDSLMDGARPVEIAAMAKSASRGKGSSPIFYSTDWSYGLFGPQGEPRLLPGKVEECHRCHSIAFQLTGDLIFTRFPGGRNFPLRKR